MADRPNILILMSDQQRADSLGCYSNAVCRTPSLDGFASEGVLCENGPSKSSSEHRMPSCAGLVI